MSRYRRPHFPGASVYFTVCLADRGSTLLVDEIVSLRAAVQATLRRRPFHIDAWVVLPDHMHCVWTLPDGDANYSERWGAIKARFTRDLRDACRVGFQPTLAKAAGHGVGWNPTLRRSRSQMAKGDAGIWQRRFWEHHIRDAADYDAHVRHCWTNPVRHGLVQRPEDWPYSSIHRDIRMGSHAGQSRVHAALVDGLYRVG